MNNNLQCAGKWKNCIFKEFTFTNYLVILSALLSHFHSNVISLFLIACVTSCVIPLSCRTSLIRVNAH